LAERDICRVKFLIVEENSFMRVILKQSLRAFGVLEIQEA